MTTLVVGIVLIVAGVAFAAAPFLRRQPREEDAVDAHLPSAGARPPSATAASATRPSDPARAPVPHEAALSLAAELEELELDRAMGKLADADYDRLRAELLRRGGAMASSVTSESSAGPAAPGSAAVALAEAAERLVREARDAQGAGRHCATCGPRPEPGARFCSRCGMALGGCPACGATARADGARFCDQCGTPLIA